MAAITKLEGYKVRSAKNCIVMTIGGDRAVVDYPHIFLPLK